LIRLENVSVRAGSFSLSNVWLEVKRGQYGILMGRTGSGKTTLLEAICGLRKVVAGRVLLMDREVTFRKPAARGVGFVPQDGAIFPTMKVANQIGFALAVRRWKRADIDRRVGELAELLGVTSLLKRRPEGLSGGERQRIALGRALAANPGVLCLDEPLSALDDATREEMYSLLKSVREHTGVTTLHITHSHNEARRLGDVVLQIADGRVSPVSLEDLAALPDDSSPTKPLPSPQRQRA
jgi:ABC-type sugar transport system ATPase subunit